MFWSCRLRVWCVSDDSELFPGSLGLSKHYEKHFGEVEQDFWMIAGDFLLGFFWDCFGCIFEKSEESREALRSLLLELSGDQRELGEWCWSWTGAKHSYTGITWTNHLPTLWVKFGLWKNVYIRKCFWAVDLGFGVFWMIQNCFQAVFGLTYHNEKHFGVVEQ